MTRGFCILLSLMLIISGQLSLSAFAENRPLSAEKKYLGFSVPDTIPQLFAPGLFSTHSQELNAVFTPDGKEFYYTMADARRTFYVIMFSQYINEKWTEPQTAPFSGKFSDADPFITADGKKLFFISRRPLDHSERPKDFDMWMVERIGNNWSEPKNLGPEINSSKDEMYVSVSNNGTIYFSCSPGETRAQNDLYFSKPENGKYTRPVSMGEPVNTTYPEWDPFIAPDESYIIFSSFGRSDDLGNGDMYISFKNNDGSWSKSLNMGPNINSSAFEFCPGLSPDGNYLFFSRDRDFGGADKFNSEKQRSHKEFIKLFDSIQNGLSNLYWVDIKVLKKLMPGA